MVKKIVKKDIKKSKRTVSKFPVRKTKSPKPTPKKKITKKVAKKVVTKIRRSRSMEETIKQAKQYEANCARRERLRAARLTRPASSATKKSAPARVGKVVAAPIKTTTKKPSARSVKVVPGPLPKIRVPTGKSKVSSASRTNLKHDPTLPIAQFGVIDICFCIDATGSMTSYLAESKKTVIDIINQIETKVQTEGIQLRFAVVTYRDHPPQESTYVTKVQDFTDDRRIRTYIESLGAAGGGDFAQAVHDGLLVAARDLTWRNYPMVPSLRYIFHIADAPPHGKQFNQGSTNGCTCGITTDAVTHAINHQQIHYRLIKINSHPNLNKMQQVFKKSIMDFDSAEIKHARQMNIKVSDMIIRQIMPL